MYVQDLWSDMKKFLEKEDSEKKIASKDGYYADSILHVSRPNINTFKIDAKEAEIKSIISSNVADTVVFRIKWKIKEGKYVFDKYSTTATTIDDYDPLID